MLALQPFDRHALEKALLFYLPFIQQVFHDGAKLCAKPLLNGNAEPFFRSIHTLRGNFAGSKVFQEYFGVTPDLATFGKGMANGFPLAAIVGPGSIMKMMEEIFFSFTFGGETLSLAAALATLTKLQRKPVLKQISAQGSKIIEKVKERIKTNNLSNVLSISGHPAWTFLHFLDCPPYSLWQVKTLFLQEIFKRGILSIGTHNMCYAHSDNDIERLGEVYDEVFSILSGAIEERKLEEKLNCKPLEPLFVIR